MSQDMPNEEGLLRHVSIVLAMSGLAFRLMGHEGAAATAESLVVTIGVVRSR
ncbi:hypothetical protein FRAHR75_1490005 [Frankia sp. Hr75.2]|nr:hypothetical protein FRAHR75_1490005 [Frankia sp. Hr75.2]